MKVLLIRPKTRVSLGVLSFVNVEPLELEYLAAVCIQEVAVYEIYDGSIEGREFESKYMQVDYDAVVVSGYINSIDIIKSYAKYIKQKNKHCKVIVGGVVAEVTPELLYSSEIDIIIHSGGFEPFRKLLQCNLCDRDYIDLKGICFRDGNKWVRNDSEVFDIKALPIPNREHFYANLERFGYLGMKPIAIMKTSYSCPYRCNFCYCCKLNSGKFVFMDLDQIIAEVKSISCESIWIVDDIFLYNRERVLAFVDRIKVENIKKRFIVYSRADFIAANEDLLSKLKDIGLEMVIVGLEAADDSSLQEYNKLTSQDMNRKCVRLLDKNGIRCTGLFIVNIDYRKQEFKRLRKWIEDSGLKLYTISVFTPLPGTAGYEKYKDKITSMDYGKYDFLHLVMNPIYMGRRTFYYEVGKLYIPYIQNMLKEHTIGRFKQFFSDRRSQDAK